MTPEELESKLVDEGYDVQSISTIEYGAQLKLVNGSIVNLYTRKGGKQRIVLQGKEDKELKELISEINYDINYKATK